MGCNFQGENEAEVRLLCFAFVPEEQSQGGLWFSWEALADILILRNCFIIVKNQSVSHHLIDVACFGNW